MSEASYRLPDRPRSDGNNEHDSEIDANRRVSDLEVDDNNDPDYDPSEDVPIASLARRRASQRERSRDDNIESDCELSGRSQKKLRKQHCCSRCKRPNHNIQTCPHREEDQHNRQNLTAFAPVPAPAPEPARGEQPQPAPGPVPPWLDQAARLGSQLLRQSQQIIRGWKNPYKTFTDAV